MLSTPWINSSALLERMNFSLALAGNRLSKGVTADWLGQLGAVSLVPDLEERQIEIYSCTASYPIKPVP